MTLQNPVDDTELHSFLGCHEVIALTGCGHFFYALTGLLSENSVHACLDGLQALHVDCHIRDLALGACRRLVDHNLGVGQSHTLALGACCQQECTHGCSHADADGSHIALNVLHGIINCHTCGHAATGAVDIKLDILVRILCFQIQQLRNDQAGGGIVDFLGQENNAIVQQTGENIIAALTAAGLLNNIGYLTHGHVSFQGFETF